MLDKKRNLCRFATSIDAFKEDEGPSLWRRCTAVGVGDDHGPPVIFFAFVVLLV